MGLDPSREIIWKIAASIDYKPQEIQLDANRAIQTATSQVFRGYDTFYRTQQKTQLDDKSFVNLTNKAFGNPYHYNPLFSSNFEKTVQTKLDSIIEKYDENESTLSKHGKEVYYLLQIR